MLVKWQYKMVVMVKAASDEEMSSEQTENMSWEGGVSCSCGNLGNSLPHHWRAIIFKPLFVPCLA